MAHIIVFGNYKGGTGKSTLCLHIINVLLHNKLSVVSLDIDSRQGTLSRYLSHRRNNSHEELLMHTHEVLTRPSIDSKHSSEDQSRQEFLNFLDRYSHCDFIVIDTPGGESYLCELAHRYANTLITPINDSFIDIDVIIRLEQVQQNQLVPSIYAEMVWEQKKQQAMQRRVMDWVVIRNRIASLSSRNQKEVILVLESLGKKLGYNLLIGFKERVIFKELFLQGMTLLDKKTLSLAQLSAKQELRQLCSNIKVLSGLVI